MAESTPTPDRRKADLEMRQNVEDLLSMMHDLAPKMAQFMPIIDQFEARLPIIDQFAAHIKAHAEEHLRDKDARDGAEVRRVTADQTRELQMSTQTASVTWLELRARKEDAEVEARRYRVRVLLQGGALLMVTGAGIVDTAFLSASWGHFMLSSSILVAMINAVLIAMAAGLKWAATPIPPLSPQQLSPVTTVPPTHVP